jgi:hypothetical protein
MLPLSLGDEYECLAERPKDGLQRPPKRRLEGLQGGAPLEALYRKLLQLPFHHESLRKRTVGFSIFLRKRIKSCDTVTRYQILAKKSTLRLPRGLKTGD